MNTFLTDFGFTDTRKEFALGFSWRLWFWRFLVYVFVSLGIYLREAVNIGSPKGGINVEVLTISTLIASFVIGLAMLAPILRYFSKKRKGKLSFEHCLAAFTIGFFADLCFKQIFSFFL